MKRRLLIGALSVLSLGLWAMDEVDFGAMPEFLYNEFGITLGACLDIDQDPNDVISQVREQLFNLSASLQSYYALEFSYLADEYDSVDFFGSLARRLSLVSLMRILDEHTIDDMGEIADNITIETMCNQLHSLLERHADEYDRFQLNHERLCKAEELHEALCIVYEARQLVQGATGLVDRLERIDTVADWECELESQYLPLIQKIVADCAPMFLALSTIDEIADISDQKELDYVYTALQSIHRLDEEKKVVLSKEERFKTNQLLTGLAMRRNQLRALPPVDGLEDAFEQDMCSTLNLSHDAEQALKKYQELIAQRNKLEQEKQEALKVVDVRLAKLKTELPYVDSSQKAPEILGDVERLLKAGVEQVFQDRYYQLNEQASSINQDAQELAKKLKERTNATELLQAEMQRKRTEVSLLLADMQKLEKQLAPKQEGYKKGLNVLSKFIATEHANNGILEQSLMNLREYMNQDKLPPRDNTQSPQIESRA